MRKFLPRVPFILVGCKMDLREDAATAKELRDKGINFVTREEVGLFGPTASKHTIKKTR